MEELELVIKAQREKEERLMTFYASFKGVDLRNNKKQNQDKFDEVKRRAEAKLQNRSVEELEYDDLGIEFETM